MHIQDVILEAFNLEASDIHCVSGNYVRFRIHGELTVIKKMFSQKEILSFIKDVVPQAQVEQGKEIDFSFSHFTGIRFRVHFYFQKGMPSLAIRLLPKKIPLPEDLGLPKVLNELIYKKHGLVLVTGPTGSGKSTTIASLIHYVNQTKKLHIVTLENPIEYLHTSNMSLVSQREVGEDTRTFTEGVRAALREDPDLIMIGELRDQETIQAAIRAAEAGRLVLGTLHTSRAVNSIQRMIEGFSKEHQGLVRSQLASSFVGILSQRLVKRGNSNKREGDFEVLVNTPAVANLIRTNQLHQIESLMQTGANYGMKTFEIIESVL